MEQAHHKTFGAAPSEDLKKRIDSSDQDENASYEELDENDLKTHSDQYSEPEQDDSKLNIENIQRLQKSLKEEAEDSYSDEN